MYYHSIECYEWFFFPGKEMCSLNSKFNLTPFMSPSVVRCVFCNGCKNGESSLSRSISPPPLRRQILEAEKGLLTDRDPSSSSSSSSCPIFSMIHIQQALKEFHPLTAAFWLKFIGKFIEKWMREAARYWLWEENTTHLEWGGKRGRNLAIIDRCPVHVLIFILQY